MVLLQASMAETEQETPEHAMTANQERQFTSVAAECKVSNQTLLSVLEDIELESWAQGDTAPGASNGSNAFELLPSSSIHRLGLGVHDLTMFVH